MQLSCTTFAFFRIFDTVRKITYKNLKKWYDELRQYRPEIPCFCAANKIDGDYKCPILLHLYNYIYKVVNMTV
jgi:GTPase SAR1 family protein